MGSSGLHDEGEALMRLMEVATLCSLPMALKAAIRLNVMDILANHGGQDGTTFLSAAQIAAHFASPTTSLSSLDRILRLLASHGLLSSSLELEPDGCPFVTYGLNSTSRYFVHPDKGSLASYVSLVQDPVLIRCLYDLHEAVLDSSVSPFTKVHGMNIFSYTQQDKRFDSLFNMGLVGLTKAFMHSLLEIYHGFDEVERLVDVGGGSGVCLGMITSNYPKVKGINFDLPHVVATAPVYSGVQHVGGDMFESIPRGDAILLKWVLHNWSDAHCMKILENCYQALPNGGKVIIVDVVLPIGVETSRDAHVGYRLDLMMLAYFEGGKERSELELENLSKATGFKNMRSIRKVLGFGVVELYKN